MKKNLKVIQFLLFLLLNGALIAFFRSRAFSQAKYGKDKGISETMSFVQKCIEEGDTIFYGAFIFTGSKEGHDYWVELCEKWEKTNKF